MKYGYKGHLRADAKVTQYTEQVMRLIKSHPEGIGSGTIARKIGIHPNYVINAINDRLDVCEDDEGRLMYVNWRK